MNERTNPPAARRTFLAGASTLAAGTMFASAPALATGARYAQSLRLYAEGDIRLDWVLSLLPLNVPPLPPGTLVKGRFQFPTPVPAYRGKDLMSVYIYALLPFPPPNNEVPISAFHASIENVALDRALVGGDAAPVNNVAMSGRVASVEWPSPFGDLTGRTFAFGCGFTWIDNQHSAAAFKLLAGTIAGSHVTVAPEAAGIIEIKRPWQSY